MQRQIFIKGIIVSLSCLSCVLLTTVVKDRFTGTLCSEATGPNTMIKISSLTLKFLSGFNGTVYLCVWDGGATTGVRCVWWWGREGVFLIVLVS